VVICRKDDCVGFHPGACRVSTPMTNIDTLAAFTAETV